MKTKYLKILIISTIFLSLNNYNLFSQNVFYHFYDAIQKFTGNEILLNSIYIDKLYEAVQENDSISIWILEADTCDAGNTAGIPYCQNCNVGANLVLQNAFKFSQLDQKVVVGSCWDYLNAVYSSIESDQFRKVQIFDSKKKGPYAPKELLQPGDWVYHINRQYHNIEHSAIFVAWKDYNKGIAITLSYMGMNSMKIAKFGEYDLNSVYAIFRMFDEFW